MARHISGIVAYRWNGSVLEIFLVHPGNTLRAKRDRRTWSIPKGEFDPQAEDSLAAAEREFRFRCTVSAEAPGLAAEVEKSSREKGLTL